jgi:hypothetical protein
MKEIMIFGKKASIMEQEADRDSLYFKNNIFITCYKKRASSLLGEFLADLLYS